MPSRSACMRKSGPVSITTRCPSQATAMDGRVRRSRGSVEVHTRQAQPSVGTPMEVPLPNMVISALWMEHAPWQAAETPRLDQGTTLQVVENSVLYQGTTL